ncbi:hypothetical protein MCO_01627 [Bartonella sp. DB5-6]|nr:hypothetical protein MCO_01627 [Bartonella sp. DB5-6]
MNTLIEITEKTIEQAIIQTVNARELHTFWGIKNVFCYLDYRSY